MPVARAPRRSATGSRRSTSTTACAATSPTRTRASAARCSAPKSWTGRGGSTEDELREIRYSFATDSLRATGHTASDQVETVLYRLVSRGARVGDRGEARGRRRAPAARVGARRRRPTAASRARVPHRQSNPDTKRGLIRERDPAAALRELHPAPDGTCSRSLDEDDSPALDELLARTAGTRRLDLGGGVSAVREYDRSGSSARPSRSTARCAGERWRIAPTSQALRYEGGGPATGSPGARRRSRTCSSTPRSHVRNARPGRSWCAGTRSSPFRGSSRRRA